ncbi:MAG: threonine synthase [Spirochaetia bacterium]|nr:threonine synthase [Spirochaetota bacterium]MDW8113059.1 threonine synthase [Spirochaetia bacterium]
MFWNGIINHYRDLIDVITDKTPVITLLEGNTPLIRAVNLGKELGIDLFIKYEGLNPTGSFKDRGMTVAISKAVEKGVKATICASTGNTSASAAAYSARAGLKSFVLIPKGYVALGKLAQAMIYGSVVLEVKGNFDDALNIVKESSEKLGIEVVNSINPFRLEGQKTASFEICDALGRAPDIQVMPVGNAGNITAYWMGYKQYKEIGKISTLPKMFGVQATGAAPIVYNRVFEKPETIATAIRIGNPARWKEAVQARDESGGKIIDVSDKEIIEGYKKIASMDGIFIEPASAASIAGLIKLVKTGDIPKGSLVVAIATGNGLKDPNTAISNLPKTITIRPSIKDVEEVMSRF